MGCRTVVARPFEDDGRPSVTRQTEWGWLLHDLYLLSDSEDADAQREGRGGGRGTLSAIAVENPEGGLKRRIEILERPMQHDCGAVDLIHVDALLAFFKG